MIVVRPAVKLLYDVNQVGFRTGVEGAGGLIKDHDRGIP